MLIDLSNPIFEYDDEGCKLEIHKGVYEYFWLFADDNYKVIISLQKNYTKRLIEIIKTQLIDSTGKDCIYFSRLYNKIEVNYTNAGEPFREGVKIHIVTTETTIDNYFNVFLTDVKGLSKINIE